MAPLAARVRPHAGRLPVWRRLHLVADAAYGPMLLLWQDALRRFQRGLSRHRLQQAQTTDAVFGVETLWRAQWQQQVAQPIRLLLPPVVTDAVTRGGVVQMEVLGALLDEDLGYVPDLPEAGLAIMQYVGQQEQRIWQTSLLGLRAGVHAAREEDLSEPQTEAWLHAVAGLTPGQVATLTRHETQRREEGQPWRERLSAVERLAEQGRLQRAQTIAATESMASVNLGTQDALQQVVRRGLPGLVGLRKYWTVTPDERLCARCLAVATTYAAGVALTESFQTPDGAMLTPPLHVRCRCVLTVRFG